MVSPMDEPANSEIAFSNALIVIGTVIGVAGLFAGGGLVLFAGVAAFACLAGSIALTLNPPETPFERDCRECDEGARIVAAEAVAPTVGKAHQPQSGQRWRQSVTASRQAGRVR
jgi:hypothetical protein